MTPAINMVKVTEADIAMLSTISRETFFAAFYYLNNADDMEAYAASSFSHQKLSAELRAPGAEFYFAMLDGEVAGFIKINTGEAQNEYKQDNSLEIERLYVLAKHQNKKLGRQMLNFAFDKAADKKVDFIWLGVWEHNLRAIKLYESLGFTHCGSHDFMLGTDRQTDLLLKRAI
ncbi:GNAT family N-acetyltransferase [Mucilaginibacter sp. CSA2-8R]|uniref:GNAT family N-acetyltransferase n=1 Tax=Mucilaginibacter sp. CSA2-8R TaxID=3141542 RepID=UPI00315DE6D1